MKIQYTFTVSEAEQFLADYYADTMAAHQYAENGGETNVSVTIIPDSPTKSHEFVEKALEDYLRSKTERRDWDDDLNSSQFGHREYAPSRERVYEEAQNCVNSDSDCEDCQQIVDDYHAQDRVDEPDFSETTYEQACVCDTNAGQPCDDCQRIIQEHIDSRIHRSFYDNRNDGTGWGNDDMFSDEFVRVRLKAGRNKYFVIDRESDTILATRPSIGETRNLAHTYETMPFQEYEKSVEWSR